MENALYPPPQQQKERIKIHGANWILVGLMNGRFSYLAKRPSSYRKREWCIYDGKASPLEYIGNKTFLMISQVLKEDKIGRHTVDLRKVRSLRRNHGLKKMYTKIKKQQNEKADGVQKVQV